MHRRRVLTSRVALLAVILWGTLSLMVLGGWPAHAAEPVKVRMGSFSVAIDYAPYLIAKEKKWFEEALGDAGVSFEYATFQTLPPINEALATNRVDLVFEAEVPAIIGRAAGVDIQIAYMSCTLNSELVLPSTSKIDKIAALKGKKIAVLAGTGVHYGLMKALEQHGLSKRDLTVVNMVPPDAKAAFETGVVDAWAVWPPWAEQELVAGKGRIMPGVKSPVQVIMVTRGQFAQQHPEVVSKIIAVLDRAKQWLQQNPAEAQKLVSQTLELPLEVVKLAWPKNDWTVQLTSPVLGDIQNKADFLKAEGFIKQAIDVRREMLWTPRQK